jgi:hypothetical protein
MPADLVTIQSRQHAQQEVPYALLAQKEKHFALLLRAYIATGLFSCFCRERFSGSGT